MSEPMPSIPTQSTFTYPNPNPSASPSFTQDDTSESFIPEPSQPMPTFTQPAFSQPNQPVFSQPAVHFQQTQPTQTQQYPNNVQSQQFQQFQTASISANNAKFPYLEKDKYEIWAMKMEYWIQNADHNLWRIVQQGNSPKRLGKDAKGNTIVHPPVSLDEHVAVQRENKVRTLLLQALPEDHMPDFHHYDDARDIWIAVKARFGGNEESKKMRKTMLKQQFTEFTVTEEEGLHKGYDKFQKILSQLNQVQARPDNDDINLKFLRALPSSWSQVALALKTRGGLESMSFDDLYNKLRSLELDVRIGHSYGVKAAAGSTHSAFIGAASPGSKPTYSDQQNTVSSVSQMSGRSDNIMECVLHSFVAENEPDQDMIYEDFDQVDQLEMEELDLKWQMAMLSLRINRFEKKAGRKMNYNNQQPARFDRRKVRCYKCLQLGHFARECNVKTVDDKARYSAFKVTEVKTDEPKALVSVDSMVNWSDHAAENKTGEVEKVYGMMAGLHADNGGADVSDATAEFAMMGISPKVQNCPLGCDSKINDLNNMYNNLDRLYNDCYIKVQAYQNAVKTLESQKDWYHKTQIALEEKIRVLSANLENTTNTLSYTEKLHDQAQKEKKEWEVKFEATLARFEKWKESSKNLKKLINSSMSTRTKIGLGFKEYFGKDEVFDLSTPSVFYPEPVEEDKPLYSWFVKAGEMHAVPPSITGTYMPTPYKSDIEETQVSYGSKSDNKTSEPLSESNDFVSCDNSDKSSDSETYASCDSSLKTKTKDFPPTVDIKTLPESDVEDPNSTAGSPSFSCLDVLFLLHLKGVSVLGRRSAVSEHNHINAAKCKKMKLSQDMQLIQKLRHDQKRMKKVFEVMSGRNIVTNLRVTPSWREIVSLTFSEAGVLHLNWTSFGHCVSRRASAIAISSDSLNKSVGSPPSRVILFGDIPTVIPSTSMVAPETSTIAPVISSAAPVVETTLVASPTGLCGLVPYSDSDSDSPDEMSSPEHISPLPAISPFLCTDSSEAPDSSDGPPSQDPYVMTVARWRSKVASRPSSSSEFPIAPVTAPPGIPRRLAWRRASPRSSDHHPSSSSSSSDSLPVHSSGLDVPDQAHSGSSTRNVSPRLESSSGDSSERPLHSSLHSVRPSHKRCKSPVDSVPSSTLVMGSLTPTHADLLPPRKRFRDSYS
ncbi:putative ribonuclease H-like domain-containing protein [Tanacetum coccineum]